MRQRIDTATFWIENGRLMMRSSYVPEFVLQMKIKIPPGNRKWDPEGKLWTFDPVVADDLMALAEKFYKVTVVEEGGGKSPAVQTVVAGTDPYSVIARHASWDILQKLYKSAVVENHPDHGGSDDKIKMINAAWKEIRKERGL